MRKYYLSENEIIILKRLRESSYKEGAIGYISESEVNDCIKRLDKLGLVKATFVHGHGLWVASISKRGLDFLSEIQ